LLRCGADTRFVLNSWVLPASARDEWGPESLGELARRETLLCGRCSSSLRVRRLADVLLEYYADAATSIAELVEEPRFRAHGVAEINAVGGMHPFLARHPRLRHSEYSRGGEDATSCAASDSRPSCTSATPPPSSARPGRRDVPAGGGRPRRRLDSA
jgi:hypothetical protein